MGSTPTLSRHFLVSSVSIRVGPLDDTVTFLFLFILDTLSIMSSTYLVLRKSGYSFLFRSIIPKDLQTQLGSRQFQLSLKCGIRHRAKSLALHLYNLTQQIYASIRQSPAKKQLTPEQIKERLKLELGNIAPSNQAITANQK